VRPSDAICGYGGKNHQIIQMNQSSTANWNNDATAQHPGNKKAAVSDGRTYLPSRARSPSMTSLSTKQPAPRPARTVHPNHHCITPGRIRRRLHRLPAPRPVLNLSRGRRLELHERDALQREHRQRAKNPAFQHDYRTHRPMVERSIVWFTRCNRRVPHHGIKRNNAWLQFTDRRTEPSTS
jgi:hypothetical protein